MLSRKIWISESMSLINLQSSIIILCQATKTLKFCISRFLMMKVRSVLLLERCLSKTNRLSQKLLCLQDLLEEMDTKLKRSGSLTLKMHANALFFLKRTQKKCFSSQKIAYSSGIMMMKEKKEELSIA